MTLYNSEWRKISKSHSDLNLGLTMPNIELVPVIFMYYNVFKLHVPTSISFLVIVEKHTHTDAHNDSEKYTIVQYCKNATIISDSTHDWYRNCFMRLNHE